MFAANFAHICFQNHYNVSVSVSTFTNKNVYKNDIFQYFWKSFVLLLSGCSSSTGSRIADIIKIVLIRLNILRCLYGNLKATQHPFSVGLLQLTHVRLLSLLQTIKCVLNLTCSSLSLILQCIIFFSFKVKKIRPSCFSVYLSLRLHKHDLLEYSLIVYCIDRSKFQWIEKKSIVFI